MKNKTYIFLLSIIVNLIFIGFITYKFMKPKHDVIKVSGDKEKRSVAVFTPVTHPSLEEIENGFKNTLAKSNKYDYRITTYNANGNRTLMHSQAEEIVRKRFDLIFSIGTGCTKMVKEVTSKKNKMVPIVFGAVNNPVEFGIVESEKSSGNNVTGVTEDTDYPRQMSIFSMLKPNMKRLLLLYNPTEGSGLDRDEKRVKELAREHGIDLVSVEVYKTNEIYHKALSLAGDCDGIMILKDNTTVSAIDAILKVARKFQIPLFVSDLDSVDKGAAVGFGVTEYDYGVAGAVKALLVLEQGKKPKDIPVSGATDFKVKINTKTMNSQGLQLSDDLLFVMKNSMIT